MSSTCRKVYLGCNELSSSGGSSLLRSWRHQIMCLTTCFTPRLPEREHFVLKVISLTCFLNPDFLQLTAYSFTSWCLLLYPFFKISVKSLKIHFVSICLKIEKLEWNQLLTSVNLPPKKTNWKIKVYKNIFTPCYVVFPGEENKP